MADSPSPRFPAAAFLSAEETIEAIHRGSIDAVVVQGADGPQVIMLHGAEEPYRVLVERMSDGAATLTPDGTVLYANNRLGEMVDLPASDVVGRKFDSLFAGPPPSLLPNAVSEGLVGRRDDPPLPVSVWAQPLLVGSATATLVTLTDLSVHHRATETAAAERFARSILEQATDAILVLARDGSITHASWMAEQLATQAPVGRTFSEAFPLDAAAQAEAGRLARFSVESLDTLLATRPFHGVEVKLRDPRLAKRTFLLSAGPLLNDAKESVGSIVTLTEITERKRAEEQQTILVAELNHRVKNILAIVQSVAAQTVRSSASLEKFNDAFSGRLKALSIAHDILTHTRWIGIGLNELLQAVLEPYRAPGEERISLDGPALMLPARAVLPLSMALHELTTNAAKYGALSIPAGLIDVTWRVVNGGSNSIELTWHEHDGPRVEHDDTSPGFGTKLIERVVNYDLDGKVAFDFDPAGLRCTIAFPIGGGSASPTETPASAVV